MSEQEIVDNATKIISEAKNTINPEHRAKIKQNSYLGELTDLAILQKALVEMEKGLNILKPIRINEYEKYYHFLTELKQEIKKYEPVIKTETPIKTPKSVLDIIGETPKKRGRRPMEVNE